MQIRFDMGWLSLADIGIGHFSMSDLARWFETPNMFFLETAVQLPQ